HLCEVTEAILNSKLTYSWRYNGYNGISYVTFELFPEAMNTRLLLRHDGLESFPQENADFHKKNFVEGWHQIINIALKKYIDELPVSGNLSNNQDKI
ncbi:MAG: SRPBCC domain-containing protein, partial [Ferruginibacter sp.]